MAQNRNFYIFSQKLITGTSEVLKLRLGASRINHFTAIAPLF